MWSSDKPLSLSPGDSAMRDGLVGQGKKQRSEGRSQAENMGSAEGSTQRDQVCCLSIPRAFSVVGDRVVRLS